MAVCALLALAVLPARVGTEVRMRGPDMEFVLSELERLEGGYADIEGDAGGETFYGISQLAKAEYLAMGLTWPPDPAQARTFYRNWLLATRLLEMPISDRLAAMAFAFRVHNDVGPMTKMLQAALCRAGQTVSIDGKLGPATQLALAYADDGEVYEHFVSASCGWYLGKKTWDRFGLSFLRHRLRVTVG